MECIEFDADAMTEEEAADGNQMDGKVLLEHIKNSTKELKEFSNNKKKGLKKQVGTDSVGLSSRSKSISRMSRTTRSRTSSRSRRIAPLLPS